MNEVSETVRTGGLTGQGFKNLLGRPRLGPVPLVLREAVQNTWDARRPRSTSSLRFEVRVRELDRSQEKEFRKIFDQSGAIEPVRRNGLAKQLRDTGAIRVLELSDFGTVGMTGSTRPDLPRGGLQSRFVDFFFDVGRSHEETGDGGTYGFGRSSLYTAGRASTILVDSLIETATTPERRLMGCRIGEAFEVASGWKKKGRYSGRHYWGRARHGFVEPLLRDDATLVADRLGLPKRRTVSQTGTTIMIPWPVDGFERGNDIVGTLVHHLWPKMVRADGKPTIEFSVEIFGVEYSIPDPTTLDEYRLFVQALKMARTRRERAGAQVIETIRPKHVTGYLGVVAGVVKPPEAPSDEDEDNDGEKEVRAPARAVGHIALMRPSELVVKYLPVPGTEQAGKSWAGVFMCDSDDFVRTAFARAEPPAHDDWIADRLQDRHERYIVRKTVVSLLPEAVRRALGLGRDALGDDVGTGASLGAVSARFSDLLLAGDGPGPSKHQTGATGRGDSGGARGHHPRVSTPVFAGLELKDRARVAVFRVTVSGTPGRTVCLRATPSIHAEGPLDAPPEGLLGPSIIGFKGGAFRGDSCEVPMSAAAQDVEIRVAFHDDYGVTLACAVEEPTA